MKINRKELLDVLKKIKPGIASKDSIEQATHFIFNKKSVLTYNDQISISHPFKSDLSCTVPAKEFYEILSKIEDEEIDFSIQEEKIQFKTKRAKLELSIHIQIDKSIIVEPGKEWKKLPKNFIDGISFCSFSAAKENTHPVLTAIYISGNEIISSDNFRISQYFLQSKISDVLLFNASIVKELIKFPVHQYSTSDAWIFFKTEENVIFACRKIEGTFPNVSSILEVKGKEIILPDETKKAVDISSVLAEGELDYDKKINVSIKDGKLICSGQREIGKIDFTIKADSLKGKEFNFGINPDFFKVILAKSNSVIIDKTRLTFISENFKHIISLY